MRVPSGPDDVEPLGEEEVDLPDVLLEGGVAGGVVVDVVGGAEALAGVQGDVGGAGAGLAVLGERYLLAGLEDRLGRGWRGPCSCGIVR